MNWKTKVKTVLEVLFVPSWIDKKMGFIFVNPVAFLVWTLIIIGSYSLMGLGL